jgi:hypothetical protein
LERHWKNGGGIRETWSNALRMLSVCMFGS